MPETEIDQFVRQKLPTTSSFPVRDIWASLPVVLPGLIVGPSMVNLSDGEIIIDGYNIRHIGLRVLRSALALVPQDTTLLYGTLRDNLWVMSA